MKIGTQLIILLTLAPIALWWEPSLGPNQVVNPLSLGQILALVGATLLAINFVLSSRLRFLETLFGGLNKVYIIHHITGSLAVIFLSLHPILIGFSHLRTSVNAALDTLFPPITEFAPWFGLLAYLTLVTLIILTLYINLPYHVWKLTHKFMGLALVFAFIHVWAIPSTVAYNMPLRVYMLSVMGGGIVTYFYRTLLGNLLVKRYRYQVSGVDLQKGVTKITLAPTEKKMAYIPGQFIFIKFLATMPGAEEHPFSLTSSPKDEKISIAPKISGDYTAKLKNLKPGTLALVEGPFGAFSYKNSPSTKQIWIAGGIGITPFVAMAKTFEKDNGYEAVLYYQTSTPDEAIFLKSLEQIAKNAPNLKVIATNTQTHGRLTAAQIAREVSDTKKLAIFICGPLPMMKDLRNQFNKLGIKNSHIYTEEFSLD